MAIEISTLLRRHDFHLETNTLGRVFCGTVSHKKCSELENTLKVSKVSDVDGLDFTRRLLSLVGKKSLTGESQENAPSQGEGLTDEEISLVTDDELEAFAHEFIAHNGWLLQSHKGGERKVRINEAGKEVVSYLPKVIALPQEDGESSTNYLVRVCRHYFTEQSKRQKMMQETAFGLAKQALAHAPFATTRYLAENAVTASLEKFRCAASESMAERFKLEYDLLGGTAKQLADAARQYDEITMKSSHGLIRGIDSFDGMKSCLETYAAGESFAERINREHGLMEAATKHLEDTKWAHEGITQSAMLAKAIYHCEDKILETARDLATQREIVPENIASWLEKQQLDTCALLKMHEDLFRVPLASEMARLLDTFQMGSVAEFAYQKTKDIIDWQRPLDAITSPWLNKVESARSIAAVLELQSIGNALNVRKGFDPEFTAALRLDLGDWRDKITFPDAVFFDSAARSEFYISRGFNPALTDFPEAAFLQCLDHAGLGGESVDIELEGTTAPLSTSSEEIGLQRNNWCHNLLQRFERQIRQFINDQMTSKYGTDWPRHRLPPEIYQKWVGKKKNAGSSGEHLLLIEFADFNDYTPIICRGDQWKEVFGSKFKRKESVRESFQRLHPIRVAVMHSRIVTKDDVLYLIAETKRLSTQ